MVRAHCSDEANTRATGSCEACKFTFNSPSEGDLGEEVGVALNEGEEEGDGVLEGRGLGIGPSSSTWVLRSVLL